MIITAIPHSLLLYRLVCPWSMTLVTPPWEPDTGRNWFRSPKVGSTLTQTRWRGWLWESSWVWDSRVRTRSLLKPLLKLHLPIKILIITVVSQFPKFLFVKIVLLMNAIIFKCRSFNSVATKTLKSEQKYVTQKVWRNYKLLDCVRFGRWQKYHWFLGHIKLFNQYLFLFLRTCGWCSCSGAASRERPVHWTESEDIWRSLAQ